MNKILSIIIPTYNMERYLEKCLSSLIIDGLERVEVIVVNDGSKDRSLDIAQSFASKYPESFVIIDKGNGNYGSCINAGLYKATGKYVKVLDADDYFDTDNFAQMLALLEELDVDLFLADYTRVYDEGEKRESLSLPKCTVFDFTAECKKLKKILLKIWMHNIVYKRENLISISYKQTEGIFYTDNEWKYRPMATVRKAYYWDHSVYNYLIGREGQSVDKSVALKRFNDDLIVTLAMVKAYDGMCELNPAMKKIYYHTIFRRVRWIYKTNIVKRKLFDNPLLVRFDEELKQLSPILYKKMERELLSVPLLPFPYIKIWRKSPGGMFIRRIINLFYMKKKL